MESIGTYAIGATIGETRGSLVYRCYKETPDKTVIIKVLKSSFPSPSEIARLRYEYELIRKIASNGVVKPYEILEYRNGLALVLEDFNGVSLNEIVKNRAFSIPEILRIGAKIAEILGELHGNNIIHKDIKPHNILYNEADGRVKLTDFGISTEFTHENDGIYQPDVINGTLVYMSPEQTGRLSRSVDYRTDLYSLGITFYELLTGTLPFRSNDPLEVIHGHIAKKPESPDSVNAGIPRVLSAIVMKLMAKNAEERYQNAFALLADLRRCAQEWDAKGTIDDFRLAEHDIPIRFAIPEKLFGQEQGIGTLLAAFDRVSAGAREVLLVVGEPGIGKSSLVGAIEQPIAGKRGFFLGGKYDQFRRDIPYSAFIQSFQTMVKGIIAMPRETIEIWKARFLEALGNGANVITHLIPEFELVVGTQPPLQELGPDETRNRFNHMFKRFLATVATPEHPLALFLDDLQWADAASLDLLGFLIEETDIGHLLLIGSYRDTEVDERHMLARMLDDKRSAGRAVTTMRVSPLDPARVNQLIAHFLRVPEMETAPLAQIVHVKTGGNPFFVKQFLKTLHERRALLLDPARGWEWDLEAARKVQGTDNVVSFMVEKLARLPEPVGEALRIAACIGSRFEIEILSAVSGKGIDEVMKHIAVSVEEGLLKYESDLYHFTHDRIYEAAYSLLDAQERVRIHYEVGRRALAGATGDALEKKIFYIVRHLNRAVSLIADQEERTRLARLNLMAGSKARASSAYTMAVEYLNAGLGLLPADAWEHEYPLAFQLHRDLGECEYLSGNLERAEELFDLVFGRARTKEEKADVYHVKLVLKVHEGKHHEAIEMALACMRLYGVRLKANPGVGILLKELLLAYLRIRGKSIEELSHLPDVTDPGVLVLLKMLTFAVAPSFLLGSVLFPVICLKHLNLSLKYGNTKYSPLGYVGWAIVLFTLFGKFRTAEEFSRLGVRLSEKYDDIHIRAYAEVPGAYTTPWIHPALSAYPALEKIYRLCLECGDIYVADACLLNQVMLLYYAGENLDTLQERMRPLLDLFRKSKNEDNYLMTRAFSQAVSSYQGLTKSCPDYSDDSFDEQAYIAKLRDRSPIIRAGYLLVKLRTLYLFERYEEAYALAIEAKKLVRAMAPLAVFITEFYYLYSLILLARYAATSGRVRRKHLRTIAANQAKMKKWADNCRENFLHKYLLVEAERARLRGKTRTAMALYKKAIDSAAECGYAHNAALGCECAARFYLADGFDEWALSCLRQARYLYARWGAPAKARQLHERYPLLREGGARQDGSGAQQGSRVAPDSAGESATELAIDLNTVVRVSRMISGEIVLKSLLEKIMNILVENAGAERGFIILEAAGELCIEAEYDVRTQAVSVLQSHPVSGSDKLSAMIVQYVHRSREDVILADAAGEGHFVADPYIKNVSPKSILCSAIMNAGRVSGILYLENNLAAGAFIPERLELLRMISSQVAISIDNARLYANLEAKVAERTGKLNRAMSELWGEMQLAKKLQTILLPTLPRLEGYEVTAYMETAADVGGDYYDVIDVNGYRWLVIGDVSGHGVPAGLVMMMAQTSIHTVLAKCPDARPSELLELVNRVIKTNIQKLDERKYMTITVLSLYDGGNFYFSGLHQDLLVYRKKSGTVESFESRGMWLGMVDDLREMLYDDPLGLEPGDCLLLFTDGITEAYPKKHEAMPESDIYGIRKLREVFTRCGEMPPAGIRDEILASLEEYQVDDDVTMLIVKRK